MKRESFVIVFNILSPVYDCLISALCRIRNGSSHEADMRETMLAQLDVKEQHRLLDVGTGTGINLEHLRHLPRSVTVIDPSSGMLKQCAKRLDRLGITAELHCQSAENLHFDNESFDRILCVNVLMYARSPEQALREMMRVLAPDGKLVISVHSRWLSSRRSMFCCLESQHLRLTKMEQGIITIIVVEKTT